LREYVLQKYKARILIFFESKDDPGSKNLKREKIFPNGVEDRSAWRWLSKLSLKGNLRDLCINNELKKNKDYKTN